MLNTPFLYLYGGGSLYSNIMNVGLQQEKPNIGTVGEQMFDFPE